MNRFLSGKQVAYHAVVTDPTAAPDATYASYPSLVDRTVFVTGGADGVGAGIVEEFVLQGSRVGFADINTDAFGLEWIFNGVSGTNTGPILGGDPDWTNSVSGALNHGGSGTYYGPAATCGKICVAEVEEIVPRGSLDPDTIHLPGIYVHRLIQGDHEKRIEQRTVRAREDA